VHKLVTTDNTFIDARLNYETQLCNCYDPFPLYVKINMLISYLSVTSLCRWMTPWVASGWECLWIESQSSKTVHIYLI